MADDVKEEKIETVPPTSTTAEKQQTVEQEWQKIVGTDKIKSPEDLAKAYKELESKLGEQGVEVGQAREFIENVKPLLEAVRDDPALFAALDARLRQKSSPDNNMQNADSQTLINQEETKAATSDLVIARFEEKYGIDKLSDSERRDVRAKIGRSIEEMTGVSLNKVDLRRLNSTLENAYVLANKDEIAKNAKLEAQIEAQANEEAGISSLRSSAKNTEEITLTPDEAKVATKMGLTREQYLEGKKRSSR